MTQSKTNSRRGSRTIEPVEDGINTAFYRRGAVYLLRDCVSVGLMEAFDRPPARQRLSACIGDGDARKLIP
jgi:hypothetical protein